MLKETLKIIRNEIVNTKENGISYSEIIYESTLCDTKKGYLSSIASLIEKVDENDQFANDIKLKLLKEPIENPKIYNFEAYKNQEEMNNRLNEFYLAYSSMFQSIHNDSYFN